MRVTQKKGDLAVAKAISTFTELGFDIAVPLTESAAYDLVVDDGKKLYRLQVRYSSGVEVDLRRIHSNSKGYVVKKLTDKTYDWLYVYKPSGEEFLIKDCYIGRRSIRPKEEEKILIHKILDDKVI